AIRTRGDAIVNSTLSQKLRYGGIGHFEGALDTVSLTHRHVEAAAKTGGIEVVDFEGARRHDRFVEEVAVLVNDDPGRARRDPAYHRCKTALRVRLHPVVAGDADTRVAERIENRLRGKTLADGQLTMPCRYGV